MADISKDLALPERPRLVRKHVAVCVCLGCSRCSFSEYFLILIFLADFVNCILSLKAGSFFYREMLSMGLLAFAMWPLFESRMRLNIVSLHYIIHMYFKIPYLITLFYILF